MNESEITESARSLCSNAVRDLGPRFGVERQDFSEMLAEHHEHQSAVDSGLSEWLESGIFSGRLSEPVLRQSFWRVLAADELLSLGPASLVSEGAPDERTAKGLLRYLLIDAWHNTTAADTWLRRLSRGETLFHAHMG